MKKRIFVIFVFAFIGCGFIFSISPAVYLKGAYMYSFDTNVYSDPLVKYAYPDWLEWRVKNPYEKRYNNGFLLEGDVFFSPKARTGLSVSIDAGFAYKDNRFIPEGDFYNIWNYRDFDGMEFVKPKLFFGFGPVFRAEMGIVDLGVSLRCSLGSYDYEVDDIVFGIIAEPYINIFVTDNIFITSGFHYDAHLMSFHLNSDTEIFNKDYSMITVGGYIGVGVFFGERGR